MSKLPKLSNEEIAALSHEELADALMARGWTKENVPAKKVDRIAALKLYEPETKQDEDAAALAAEEARRAGLTDEEREAEDMETLRRASLTQDQRDAEDAAKSADNRTEAQKKADEEASKSPELKEAERRAGLTQAQRDAEDAAEGKTKGQQNGTGKSIDAKSTAPVKETSPTRPYLDSPRPFGIHISGKKGDTHLVRFQKGRTRINAAFVENFVGLDVADVLKALKTDSYVADNGAEVVE